MPLIEVTRAMWQAEPARGEMQALQVPLAAVFVTHTGTESCSDPQECEQVVRQIQRTHLEQGLEDLEYSFLVGGDGRVYEGRGWAHSACPPRIYNHASCEGRSIVIAKIGPPTVQDPCKFMERATGSIIDSGTRQRFINETTKYYFQCEKSLQKDGCD